MFIRRNKNRSGSVSIQVIQKVGRQNKVLKTVGHAKTQREEDFLMLLARNEVERIQGLESLFIEHDDLVVDSFVESIENDSLQIVGPQLVLGQIYDRMGYGQIIENELFKNLVICRLVYPGSKLKTVEYFKHHLVLDLSVYSVYRYLDELHSRHKERIEQITFEYTRKILQGRIGIVFYDITTLYFEASEEDELRIPGYSKDGKHHQPQILIGLLVGENGYPIGYEIFEGNTSETKTLVPVLQSFQKKFGLEKPIVVADAALLSQKNIDALKKEGYEFILGGRIKNETDAIKKQILALKVTEKSPKEIACKNGRLIITYSSKRAIKDLDNRMKGLKRLEKKAIGGKLTKEHINNRGYNKYLKLEGETKISIDYQKFNQDSVWDGLKGYMTNTSLTKNKVIRAYQQLWQIEKAFRISKTDLKIRPIYHRLRNRIEAHICICFTAYAIYKELERLLSKNGIKMSPEKAIAEIKEIRQLTYRLPKSHQVKTKLLRLNEIQSRVLNLIF
jgi:transposase